MSWLTPRQGPPSVLYRPCDVSKVSSTAVAERVGVEADGGCRLGVMFVGEGTDGEGTAGSAGVQASAIRLSGRCVRKPSTLNARPV